MSHDDNAAFLQALPDPFELPVTPWYVRLWVWAASWFAREAPSDTTTATHRRRRSPDRRPKCNPRYAAFTHRGLARRIARVHQNGTKCYTPRSAERGRRLTYFLREIYCATTRGWLMKNKIRRKIGKSPLRRLALWRRGRSFANPINLSPTRAERKALEKEAP